jgi:hypothetical protein
MAFDLFFANASTPELAAIRAASPFSLDKIDAILASPKRLKPVCPFRAADGALEIGLPNAFATEVARLHIAWIAPFLVVLSQPVRHAPAGDIQKALRSLDRARRDLKALEETVDQPLMQEFDSIAAVETRYQKTLLFRDRQPKQDDLLLYGTALSLYTAIYAKAPAVASTGPTIEFMSALLPAVNESGPKFPRQHARENAEGRSVEGEALKKRIKEFGKDPLISVFLEPAYQRNAALCLALQREIVIR